MDILVVDDDENIRAVLGMILRAKGHQVGEAADGVDALQHLRTRRVPGLVLLDMMMPRLDGQAVVEAMRRDPTLAAVPVVVLSGHQAAREQADRLGVAGCLVKPVELSDLLETVRQVEERAAARP